LRWGGSNAEDALIRTLPDPSRHMRRAWGRPYRGTIDNHVVIATDEAAAERRMARILVRATTWSRISTDGGVGGGGNDNQVVTRARLVRPAPADPSALDPSALSSPSHRSESILGAPMKNARVLTAALLRFVAGCTASGSATRSANPSAPAHNPAAFVEGQPYQPQINAADFVELIDNPYLPWTPGTTVIYEGGGERVEVTVTDETREIMGITATVVHDQVLTDGEVTEDTFDWYAQDRWGNVWYLGEDTKEYENGEVVSTEGSWEAGVDGAQPGIIMLADPQVGDTYRQEFLEGEAEDLAKVYAVGESVEVPQGSYDDVLVTEDWTPLDPDIVEHKFYARGVGVVREELVQGGDEVLELIEVRTA
jgi:hypothetical protein